MKIFKYSRRDSMLTLLSLLQTVLMLVLASHWEHHSLLANFGGFIAIMIMMVYNIIIISHLFTHTPWFQSNVLNSLLSMLNSFNIGQSVQIYHLTHVRNHHRYNNDQKGSDGKTKDFSSTFSDGKQGEHASAIHYALMGALSSLQNAVWELLSVFRGFRVGAQEHKIEALLSRSPDKNQRERKQITLDRFAYFLGITILLTLSWQWTLFCYLPAYYLALAWVNVQNYYEHFGANPNEPTANSVSHYGLWYNRLTFNDGHHQEHHLRPSAHWSTMPSVREAYQKPLTEIPRIISPVPAIIGFLDRKRPMLHRIPRNANAIAQTLLEETEYD